MTTKRKMTRNPRNIKATMANLEKYDQPGLFMWSPFTGEEYSANQHDYWDKPKNHVFEDSEGNEMFLVKKSTEFYSPLKPAKG